MKGLFRKIDEERNKGFSLVEVLLAIVILGLVATPILSSLFSSLKINKEAKDILIATDLAQSTMEYYESQTYEEHLLNNLTRTGSTVERFCGYDKTNDEFKSDAIWKTSSGDYLSYKAGGTSLSCPDAATVSITAYENYLKANMPASVNKNVVFREYTDSATGLNGLLACYFGVEYDGRVYDMVVDFRPYDVKATSYEYYTYDVTVDVYLATKSTSDDGAGNVVTTITDRLGKCLATVEGSVANKY